MKIKPLNLTVLPIILLNLIPFSKGLKVFIEKSTVKEILNSFGNYDRIVSVVPINNGSDVATTIKLGYLAPWVLLETLNRTKNIRHLNLISDGANEEKFCQMGSFKFSVDLGAYKVNLQKLQVLKLENFTSTCDKVYSMLLEKINADNLDLIAFKNSVIHRRNFNIIQKILRKYGNSLRTLLLENTTMPTSVSSFLFSPFVGLMPKVEAIFIKNPNSPLSTRISYLSRYFCAVFPNLETLALESGSVPLDQIRNLLPCRNLRNVRISFELESFNFQFDAAFLRDAFPKMEDAFITLYQRHCDNPSLTKFEKLVTLRGLEHLSDVLKKFTIVSNCRLKFVPKPTQSFNASEREERRFIRNGLFGMSYYSTNK